MLPLTPYSILQVNYPELYVNLTGERQRPPYGLMCKMKNWRGWLVPGARSVPSRHPEHVAGSLLFYGPFHAEAGMKSTVYRNLAYKRMVGQLTDAASLGATLTAERRETFGMIVSGLEKMLLAARQIRKLRFGDAARTLGLPITERTVVTRYRTKRGKRVRSTRRVMQWGSHREVTQTLASGWLMYSYGVSPLVGDIHTAMQLTTSECPFKRIRGSARGTSARERNPNVEPARYSVRYSVSQSVEVRVKNPNLWLANRLGLVNPLQWINEGIPFSFIVDWVSNLSDVISCLTDFVGLETRNPAVNSMDVREKFFHRTTPGDHSIFTLKGYIAERETSLVLPKLSFAYERFQWQRGLNAASLLITVFGVKK